jgi:general secretion pathway protein K
MPKPLNKSGVILASALWIIIILSLLAVSIARNSGINTALMNFSVGRLKAYYASCAGVAYAMNMIYEDSLDPQSLAFDSLYQCGLKLEGKRELKQAMTAIPVGEEGSFDIRYPAQGGGQPLGFEDEERKLNLNAITALNYEILADLIAGLGFSKEEGMAIAASVADWQDADGEVTHDTQGAESDYYGRLPIPYACKNRPFDHVDELRLVKGVRPEIFEKLKPYITVYPKRPGRMVFNFNTASPPVIKAVLDYTAQNVAGLDQASTDSVLDKLIRFRNGPDGQPMTADDRILLTSGNLGGDLNLTISEENLYRAVILAYHNPVSNYFGFSVTGTDQRSTVTLPVDVVVQRNPLTVVSWHRE